MDDLKLARLVHDVANAMSTRPGESWTLNAGGADRGFGVDMRSKAGEIVNFQTGKNPVQLCIEVCDPLTMWSVARPINVTASRHPLVIAREVANRLLPDARAELARRRAEEAKHRAEFEARAAAVNEAERLFGQLSDFGPYDPGKQGEHQYKTETRLELAGKHVRTSGGHEHVEHEFARVSTTYDGSLMGLELSSVPADVVLRMLAVLAEHNVAQRSPAV